MISSFLAGHITLIQISILVSEVSSSLPNMTTYTVSLQPPAAFRFVPTNGPSDFEQFRQASGLSAQSEARQVSTLLYMLGEDLEDVLCSTNISSDGRKSYLTVMEKLNDFFKVRIYERIHFNQRLQLADESVEHFITNLYHFVEHCKYVELKEEMVRNCIVVGIHDSALSERLQLDSELTLEKAKKLVWQKEAVHEHQQFLSSKSSEGLGAVVNAMTKGNSKQIL